MGPLEIRKNIQIRSTRVLDSFKNRSAQVRTVNGRPEALVGIIWFQNGTGLAAERRRFVEFERGRAAFGAKIERKRVFWRTFVSSYDKEYILRAGE